MKNIFVLWSGGLDSTYLIYKLLSEGNNVTAGSVNLQNNKEQIARESVAMKVLSAIFTSNFPKSFTWLETVLEINAIRPSNNMILQQAMGFPSIVMTIDSSIDEIAIGYVMHDCAISYLDEIRKIFDAYGGLQYKSIPVTFPLIKWDKIAIWDYLPTIYKDHVVWCEDKDTNNCGNCESCKKMNYLGLMKKDVDTTTICKADPMIDTSQLNLDLGQDVVIDYKKDKPYEKNSR